MEKGGKFLSSILEENKLERIFIAEGKVLIMTVNSHRYFFELAEDYDYLSKTRLVSGAMHAVPGSVIDQDGRAIDGKNLMLPNYVRFPTLEELLWYNKMKTI